MELKLTEPIKTPRLVKPAITHGFNLHCPNCGHGALMKGYVTPVEYCGTCGENFTHQRADDGPAYIVMLIVGHVVGIMLPLLFEPLGRDPVLLMLALLPTAMLLCYWLLPRVKGAMIAFQWAKRMHGFDGKS